MSAMSLILKQTKGYKLNSSDLDNNFTYLSENTPINNINAEDAYDLVAGGTLIPGNWYRVSGLANSGMLLQASTVNSFAPKAFAGFYNADIQGVGDYSYVSGSQSGIWTADKEINKMQYTVLNKYRFNTTDDLSGIFNYDECTTANSTGIVVGFNSGFYLGYVALTGVLDDALSAATFSVTSTGLVYTINSVSIDSPSVITGSIGANTSESANVYDVVDGVLYLEGVSDTGFYSAAYYTNGSEYIHAATFSGLRNDNFVIYNNLHYRVTNYQNLTGGNPTTNTDGMGTGYTTVTRNDYDYPLVNGYIEEWDFITYDFNTNIIVFREDKRGNKISGTNFGTFQWGDNGITNFIQDGTATIETQNNTGTITGRIAGTGHYIRINNNSGTIFFDITGKTQTIISDYNSGTIELHLIGFNVGVYSDNNTGQIRSYLYNSAYLECTNNKGIIHTRHYDSNYCVLNTNSGNITDCIFEKPGYYNITSVTSSVTYTGCKFGHGTGNFYFPSDFSYSNKELLANSSSFDITYDIIASSPSSVIDLTGTYAGIITLTYSSPTTIIDSIVTDRTFPIKFKPESGLEVTFNATPIASLTDDYQIVSSTSTMIVNGDTDDSIIFQRATSEVTPYVYAKRLEGGGYQGPQGDIGPQGDYGGPQGATGPVGPQGSDVYVNRVITDANDTETLLTTDSIIFANLSGSIDVYMPDVAVMQGKKMTFIRTDGGGENMLQLQGPFVSGETHYYLAGYSYNSATFVSDGTLWHRIAST